MADSPTGGTGKQVTRRELEAVIRRAAELYAEEAESEEQLSEDEVLDIAAELGLPAGHVRRALYELPHEPREPSAADRLFGPRRVLATRSVPGAADEVFHRIEEYLTTREYLQVVRRQRQAAALEPASDVISNIARAFARPDHRFHLARARRVTVQVRPLDAGRSHVRLELDVGDRRRRWIVGGTIGGGVLSAPLAVAVFIPVAATVGAMAGDVAGVVSGVAAGAGAFGLGIAGVGTLVGAHVRRRVERARLELDGLLDRLQRRERLAPPPSPWMRRLRSAVRGSLPAGE